VTRPFGPQAHVASGYCFAFDVANNKVSAMLALTAGEGGFYEPLISNYVGLVSVARLAFHQRSPGRRVRFRQLPIRIYADGPPHPRGAAPLAERAL
jgi:hypothetical protein